MTNTTQAASLAKGSIFFTLSMLLLCLVYGLPEYVSPNPSSFVLGVFVIAPAILVGILVLQVVLWLRVRKQAGVANMESPAKG